MKRQIISVLIATFLISLTWTGNALAAENYNHVHLTTTDAKAAAAWYGKHLGGTVSESGDRVMFGDVAFIWFKKKAGFAGTDGRSMEHIGFLF